MKSFFKAALAAVLATAMLAGCSFGSGSKSNENEQSTFRVMYYDENQFFQDYGMLFTALYPNIEIEVVSTQRMYRQETTDYEAAFKTFIEEEKPDLIMLSGDQYKKYAEEGMLYDLSAFIEKDKYNTEGIVPGMLDYLKELGGGQLFAMAPTFHSSALMYNKALFDKYNVPYPTDKMTWEQIYQLARQFPTEGEPMERVFGLKMGWNEDLFDLASTLAQAQGLTYVNAEKKQMTINSDSWKSTIQTAYDMIKSDTLYFESKYQDTGGFSGSYEDYLMRDPFLSGRLAMTIGETYMINQIKEAKNYLTDSDKIVSDWDLVTPPVSSQNPDSTTYMNFYNLFAITESSANKEAAWQFLSYITSDEYARVKAKSGFNNGFPIRTQYIKGEEDRNYAAFYSLKPASVNMYKDYDKLSQAFQMGFWSLMSEELAKFKDGTVSLDEALSNIQLKGDELLQTPDPEKGEEASVMPVPRVEVESGSLEEPAENAGESEQTGETAVE